eukprot:434255-Prorocentrum_minimum.AAC.1
MLQVCETRTGAATVIRAPRPEQSSYCIYQGICKERLVGTGGPGAVRRHGIGAASDLEGVWRGPQGGLRWASGGCTGVHCGTAKGTTVRVSLLGSDDSQGPGF